MRFEIELPENYDDIISITAIGPKAKVTNVLCNSIEVRGHNGELLIIPEIDRARWETPIMLNKTMEDSIKQAKVEKAKEQYGETFNSLHEAYAVALEELEEASIDFENTKTAFSYFGEDITANDDPTNDLIDAKHYTVEAIKELAQFAAVIDKTLETLEKGGKKQ